MVCIGKTTADVNIQGEIEIRISKKINKSIDFMQLIMYNENTKGKPDRRFAPFLVK